MKIEIEPRGAVNIEDGQKGESNGDGGDSSSEAEGGSRPFDGEDWNQIFNSDGEEWSNPLNTKT